MYHEDKSAPSSDVVRDCEDEPALELGHDLELEPKRVVLPSPYQDLLSHEPYNEDIIRVYHL
jgi:hypothetical protein